MEDKVSDSATAVPDEWGLPDPTKEIDKLVKEAINKALGGAERQIQNVTNSGKRQIQQYTSTPARASYKNKFNGGKEC